MAVAGLDFQETVLRDFCVMLRRLKTIPGIARETR